MFNAVQEHGNLCNCDTDVMAADIFTKHSINEIQCVSACNLIGVVPPTKWKDIYRGTDTSLIIVTLPDSESKSMPSPYLLKEVVSSENGRYVYR